MSDNLFIYAENEPDRDRVKYLKVTSKIFECGHYFRSLHLVGACFSTSFNYEGLTLDDIDEAFENITTILTKEELVKLIEVDNAIEALHGNIVLNYEKYQKGVVLYESIQPIIERLRSPENDALFEEILEEERDAMQDEYNLSDKEITEFLDNYGGKHRDRGAISAVYNNFEELGESEESNDCVFKDNEDYRDFFDFERFGEYVAGRAGYYTLSTGKVIVHN